MLRLPLRLEPGVLPLAIREHEQLANQQNFVLTELSKKIYSLQEELVSMKKDFKDELIAMKTELVSMKLTLDELASKATNGKF